MDDVTPKPLLDQVFSFDQLKQFSEQFSQLLQERAPLLLSALTHYEPYEVAFDEIKRSQDLWDHIHSNKDFFGKRTGLIKSFLPQNQPLYALTCFALVPSFQTQRLQVRPPQAAHSIFPHLARILEIDKIFPNIDISYEKKEVFAKKDADTVNAIIFTGSSEAGLNLRKSFSPEALFILNGSGHNPIVVTPTADIDIAIENTLKVTLFNQGQDCSAPSSILLHKQIANQFERQLLSRLSAIPVGPYADPKTIVGPNTSDTHVVKMASVFKKNKKHFLYGGNLNPITRFIEPTVFLKPLKEGAVFEENFSPVIMLQTYEDDKDLEIYFENPRYFQNAMYVTVFGKSDYVLSLTKKGIHLDENIIYNSNIQNHERGFLEYGGLGPRASCLYWKNWKISGATLPQRDIYRYLIDQHAEKNLPHTIARSP